MSAAIAQAQGLPLGIIPPPPPPPPTAVEVQGNTHAAAAGTSDGLPRFLAVATAMVAAAAGAGMLLTRSVSVPTSADTTTGRTVYASPSNPGRKYAWCLVALTVCLAGGTAFATRRTM